jgi:hypothetical protein
MEKVAERIDHIAGLGIEERMLFSMSPTDTECPVQMAYMHKFAAQLGRLALDRSEAVESRISARKREQLERECERHAGSGSAAVALKLRRRVDADGDEGGNPAPFSSSANSGAVSGQSVAGDPLSSFDLAESADPAIRQDQREREDEADLMASGGLEDRGGCVELGVDVRDRVPRTAEEMSELEALHQVINLYLWLGARHDAGVFLDMEFAADVNQRCVALIEKGLRHLSLDKTLFKQRKGLKKISKIVSKELMKEFVVA